MPSTAVDIIYKVRKSDLPAFEARGFEEVPPPETSHRRQRRASPLLSSGEGLLELSPKPITAYHICRICHRHRSKTYQREHPITPYSAPIPPGICSRCRVKALDDVQAKEVEVQILESDRVRLGIECLVPEEAVLTQRQVNERASRRKVYLPPTEITETRERDNNNDMAYMYRYVDPVDLVPTQANMQPAQMSTQNLATLDTINAQAQQIQELEQKLKESESAIAVRNANVANELTIRQATQEAVKIFQNSTYTESMIRGLAREEVEKYRQSERKLEAHPGPYTHGRLVPVDERTRSEQVAYQSSRPQDTSLDVQEAQDVRRTSHHRVDIEINRVSSPVNRVQRISSRPLIKPSRRQRAASIAEIDVSGGMKRSTVASTHSIGEMPSSAVGNPYGRKKSVIDARSDRQQSSEHERRPKHLHDVGDWTGDKRSDASWSGGLKQTDRILPDKYRVRRQRTPSSPNSRGGAGDITGHPEYESVHGSSKQFRNDDAPTPYSHSSTHSKQPKGRDGEAPEAADTFHDSGQAHKPSDRVSRLAQEGHQDYYGTNSVQKACNLKARPDSRAVTDAGGIRSEHSSKVSKPITISNTTNAQRNQDDCMQATDRSQEYEYIYRERIVKAVDQDGISDDDYMSPDLIRASEVLCIHNPATASRSSTKTGQTPRKAFATSEDPQASALSQMPNLSKSSMRSTQTYTGRARRDSDKLSQVRFSEQVAVSPTPPNSDDTPGSKVKPRTDARRQERREDRAVSTIDAGSARGGRPAMEATVKTKGTRADSSRLGSPNRKSDSTISVDDRPLTRARVESPSRDQYYRELEGRERRRRSDERACQIDPYGPYREETRTDSMEARYGSSSGRPGAGTVREV